MAEKTSIPEQGQSPVAAAFDRLMFNINQCATALEDLAELHNKTRTKCYRVLTNQTIIRPSEEPAPEPDKTESAEPTKPHSELVGLLNVCALRIAELQDQLRDESMYVRRINENIEL